MRRETRTYDARKVYLRAWHLARYHRRRRIALWFVAMVTGIDGCARCGDPVGPFHFDHVEPDSKGARIVQALTHAIARLWVELRKCQLLCWECHGAKTFTIDQAAIQRKRAARRAGAVEQEARAA